MPADHWTETAPGLFYNAATGTYRNINAERNARAAPSAGGNPVTAPYNDQLNLPVAPDVAKAMVAQNLAKYMDAKSDAFTAATQAIGAHIDQIINDETYMGLTGRRVAELAMAAPTHFMGDPGTIATNRAIARGYDVDRNQLPQPLQQRLANAPGPDLTEEIHHLMQAFEPRKDLSRQEAVKLWQEKVQKMAAEGGFSEGRYGNPVWTANSLGEQSIKGQTFGDNG